MQSRIMYIEDKSTGLTGPARIGRVSFSKTGRTLYYRGRSFQSLKGAGFKANYYDIETGEEFWISGPRKDGGDRLYGEPWRSRLTTTSARSTGPRSAPAPPAAARASPTADPPAAAQDARKGDWFSHPDA